MADLTIHLPSDLEQSIEDLVSQGIYKTAEEAVISLIRRGIDSLRKREKPEARSLPEHPHIPPVRPPDSWPEHYEFKK